MYTITEKERQIPVKGEYDVFVAGGGVAGISAALAAARNGARVVLAEKQCMLGGLATAGLVTIYLPLCDGCGRQVSFGQAESVTRCSLMRHCLPLNLKNFLQRQESKFCMIPKFAEL